MSSQAMAASGASDTRPILLVPYMWIGDFVRCHSVVKLLRARWPQRPIDMLTTTNGAPLLEFMPGVRKGVTVDLPRKRLPLRLYRQLAQRLRAEGYGTALVMPRTWKAALAPFLAGIPERTGFAGEARLLLLNDLRWGERRLPRMVDRCNALALPKGAAVPETWPTPELVVPPAAVTAWLAQRGIASDRPAVAFAPGSVAPARRWPAEHYGELAKRLAAEGAAVWILGGPSEAALAQQIARAGGAHVRDFTGHDLRDAVLALKAARAAVSNDSGLLHVAAALGTPTIGIFGPGDPYLSMPLNPLAAIVETRSELACRPCGQRTCPLEHHRCMREIPDEQVIDPVRRALARATV